MNKILVLGPSGLGKTTSVRNLPPEVTGIINCDMKELPIRGWRTKYQTKYLTSGKIDTENSNYYEFDTAKNVTLAFEALEANPKIKNIIIDTITHLITAEYMMQTIGKDFKAYQNLGKGFYDLIKLISKSTKNVIVFGHSERRVNDQGEVQWEMKAHGKMITDLVPASYFTTVLAAEKIKDKDGKFDYVFRTQSEGNDPAKSPAWIETSGEVKTALLFREKNDIADILEKLEQFEIEA